MCGIVGLLDWSGRHPPDARLLRRMLGSVRHRGPDEAGLYVDRHAGLGCARLSVVDLASGRQPIHDEDGSLWIVLNGEVYNHPELRERLERAGHRFFTRSDTEVVLHLYQELGAECLHSLNGQFAIAIWDARCRELFLARDRLGIRPLFYALVPHGLVFGSEIKALLLDPRLAPQLDPCALAQALTFWAPLAPRTAFRGVVELPPGHWMRVRADSSALTCYWRLSFPPAGAEERISEQEAAEQLRSLLSDATRLRLQADVPVGSYLSGGLDSTLVSALARQHTLGRLCTFSVAFEEPAFDERGHQEAAVAFLGTTHRRTVCTNADVARVFPQVVWHAEAPLLRTSPAPMYVLSRLVHESGIKVVLTGEGADEFLGGYDIYKEDKVRRFWARQPGSTWRPLLLRRLYPYVAGLSHGGDAFVRAFFARELTATDCPAYSHTIRWHNTGRLLRLLSPDVQDALGQYAPVDEFRASLDGAISCWSPLAQAQYVEVTTFMSPYLLSSQGDRMMAANSVEGRFPFLDHRVVDLSARLPSRFKVRGLREKHVLRECARPLLPAEVAERRKQPYRAPIHPAFFTRPPDYVEALLLPRAIRASGVFDPHAVARLVRRCQPGGHPGEVDDMALAAVLSTQLLHHLFIEQPPAQQEAPGVCIFWGRERLP